MARFSEIWLQPAPMVAILPVVPVDKCCTVYILRERVIMAWKRSSVRSRSGPPNNPLQIKCMPEAKHSLLPVSLCHLVSRAQKACADCSGRYRFTRCFRLRIRLSQLRIDGIDSRLNTRWDLLHIGPCCRRGDSAWFGQAVMGLPWSTGTLIAAVTLLIVPDQRTLEPGGACR
ncbi:MAG: hypothetical protein JWM43_1894 [Acidobacteriaceae bacterium]|nr:hypothetical protein [Acidobacteriaceae bacterium]